MLKHKQFIELLSPFMKHKKFSQNQNQKPASAAQPPPSKNGPLSPSEGERGNRRQLSGKSRFIEKETHHQPLQESAPHPGSLPIRRGDTPSTGGAAHPADRSVNPSGIDFVPSPDEVARRAYFSYVNQGSQPGHEVQHWLEAEAQLVAERNLTRVHGFHNRT